MGPVGAGHPLHGLLALPNIPLKPAQRGSAAGKMSKGMAAQFVPVSKQTLQIFGAELPAEVVNLVHQPHGGVESSACAVALQNSAADMQSRLGEVVEGKRHHGLRPVQRQFAPV